MHKVLHGIVGAVTGNDGGRAKVEGKVVLMKKNVLDFNDFGGSVLDGIHELVGQGVSLCLVSAVNSDPGETAYKVTFDWSEEIGLPGAFLIRNEHHTQFYLRRLTLINVPGHGRVHFECNSWVYPADKYKQDRVFFANKTYLPSQTPAPLVKYREEELISLRGNGTGVLKEWDRVYDYAFYNDLGEPDKGPSYVRPVLGGSTEYPYPRRGRTGRPPSKTDPKTESRLPLLMSLNIYVPRDERFGHLKMSDFLAYGLRSIVQILQPELESQLDSTPGEFDSFGDVLKIYEGGIKLPGNSFLESIRKEIPLELLKQILTSDGHEGILKYPMPQVIKDDKSAWRTDEEFAREMLAGVNPVIIRRLQEFPPASTLDPNVYGNQDSTMKKKQIEGGLDGLTVDEAIERNRLFILDHHDSLLPYVRRINTTSTKIYATRTVLFLKEDGTLKPLAIELSLPHPQGDHLGAVSRVFTPAKEGVTASVWELAKAYVAVSDSGHHQLISHFLNTHAVMEPFIIAANRQLSAVHPIYKLLQPHFRDTMTINALGRQILINAGGVLESTVFPQKYAMELSSIVYKNWVFPEQALPADLIKRGMAVEDKKSPHGLRLLIEDYPYAVDGLEIWASIKTWVEDYCSFYYTGDEMVQEDTELQSWWSELVQKGHGDKKDEPWWPKMVSRRDLTDSCTIIIWIASALHAALNFGMYPYAGYMPNRPTMSRRLMPEEGSPEYEELKANPEKVFLKTITAELQTLIGISIVELLSRHATDEVYLGHREMPEWTTDSAPLEAFERFGKKLSEIEGRIVQMNGDGMWKNRVGPVKVPYTLMYPSSGAGLTGMGIPNSISI
ncbi:hypothetical protein SAY86_000917 [Trapa natans]|uniref:Lipoxygenase n=1 Tax=Trapa natans TaxID=22666 RepID=A0AAN7REA4_TRANT|nr:hypothetical protein SAY86_000917 [Trapa natans]